MALGSALREATEVDPRFGGWFNADLADYVVSVNADIGDIDVAFVDRPDPLLNDVPVRQGAGRGLDGRRGGGRRQRDLSRDRTARSATCRSGIDDLV